MLKNNVMFTKWELFSIIVTGILVNFLSDYPDVIIQNSGSGSILGAIFICLITFFIYKLIVTKISKSNNDFFEYTKSSCSNFTLKLIGIIFFIYSFSLTLSSINNISVNLKTMTYNISPIFALTIYFLVSIFIASKYGFKTLFKISGYFLPISIVYIALIFGLSIPITDLTNFTPILGNGIFNITISNLSSIAMFSPLLFFLFFLKQDNSKETVRTNKKLITRIILFVSITLIILIFIFLNGMPVKLLNTRTSLLFDLNRILSFYPYSQRIEPFMIFVYTLSTFLFSTFTFLCGLYALERTGIVKDHKKYIIPTFIILVLLAFIPQTKISIYIVRNIFAYISIFVFIFIPLFVIFKHQIKEVNRS